MARKEALAYVELMGYPTAIAFADAAVKSACVEIVGYELSKGAGLVTVKLMGDVSALKAAVEAGTVIANQVGRVAGVALFPRPSDGIRQMVYSADTVGLTPPQPEATPQPAEEPAPAPEPQELPETEPSYTCNLCKSPVCPRKLGESKKRCILLDEI